MGDRYDASIDGFSLDCETLRDRIGKSIAKYEYPYRDGAETEDMGEQAWQIRIRCYFLENRYTRHIEFLEHLKSRDLFELTHPKYGIKKGRIEEISVRHDDRQETAEIDIGFVEDLGSQESAIATYDLDVTAETEEAFTDGQDEMKDSFSNAAREELGTDAIEILEKELDDDLGIVEQFPGVRTSTRTWLKAVETYVTTLQAEASDVANPANSLIAMIDYGAALPGRVIGALAQTAERYAVLYETLKESPVRYLTNIKNSMADLADSVDVFSDMTLAAGAQRLALEAAAIYAEDEEERNRQRRRETGSDQGAFDVEGNYIPQEEIGAVLTVRELEQSLADVRTELQAAVDADRTLSQMKVMARKLLEHVMVIKLERDRMVRIVMDNPMPLQAVCMMRGLSYEYAERILAINDIRQPNFTAGEIDVYAA